MDGELLSHLCTRQDQELLLSWNLSTLSRSLETIRRHIISIEPSLYWKANRSWASGEFFYLLWNPKACYCVLESLPIVHILILMNQVYILFLRWILILYYLPFHPWVFWAASFLLVSHQNHPCIFCSRCAPYLWDWNWCKTLFTSVYTCKRWSQVMCV